MRRNYVTVLLISLLLCSTQQGFCEDREDGEQVAAIQERIFHRHHEISLGFGYIPDEDFYYIFPIGLGYTYNFNERIAWEVARAYYMITAEKDLKSDLENDFGATPTDFRELQWGIHSSAILKFLYGKSVWGKKTVINHEMYGIIGGGAVVYDKNFSNGKTDTKYAPSLNLGIGGKIFLTENFCLNLEIKDWVNFYDDDTESNFWVAISLGFRFNLSPRRNDNRSTTDKLKKYLQ
jgi:outer membrane beta-barrel protein